MCALILNPQARRRRKQLEAIVREGPAEPAAGELEGSAMRDVEALPLTDQVEGKPRDDDSKTASGAV